MGIADRYRASASTTGPAPSTEPSGGPTPAETLAELRARLAGGQTGQVNPPEATLPETLVQPKTAHVETPTPVVPVAKKPRKRAEPSNPTLSASGAEAATPDAPSVAVELRRIADALEKLAAK